MGVLYEYFASGIADSGIRQFGGDDCYNEIPPLYHWTVSIFFGLLSLFLLWLWRDSLASPSQKKTPLKSNLLEKICFWIGLASFLLTLYFKVATKRGLFILNPCHISLVLMLILLAAEDNSSLNMRRLHTAWTAWLLGPFGAIAWPHLEDVSTFEFVLYYVQHLVILPIGPLVLRRRYGNILPNFKNQIASYSTILAFQMLPLVIISRTLKVNLNFTLCHSPAEPFYDDYGYHYFLIEIFNVCLVALTVRLVTYLYVEAFYWIGGVLTGMRLNDIHKGKLILQKKIMTTILNFIQGNFIANPQEKQVEKPFWVLDCANLSLNYRPIVQSLVTRCKNDKKPLVHIDLGLSSLRAYPSAQLQITSDNGILYAKPIAECPYYLVKTQIKQRKRQSFLPNLLNKINEDIRESGNLRSDKAKCSHTSYEFGILIEGLEAWSLLNKDQAYFQKDLEQFISGLMTSVSRIRQIVVATWSPLLPAELNFNLERSSTCLTKILACSNGQWKCQSTVRRYSGFSNEQEYSLQLMEGGRVKVAKKKQVKGEERSKDQIQMVNSLGFTVETDEASRQQQRELKDMIYPYLKMRQVEAEKCNVECKKEPCGCKEEDVENLIVLDEQQEDDDDLDV